MAFESSREVPDLGHSGGLGRRGESEAENKAVPGVGMRWCWSAIVESPWFFGRIRCLSFCRSKAYVPCWSL